MRKWSILSLALCLLWSFELASANMNSLSIKDGTGQPGSTNNPLEVSLYNSVAIAGLQFTLNSELVKWIVRFQVIDYQMGLDITG